ncbi:hypothetical protein NO559_03330 [Dasania sp. GY-MA-18]|uniref:Scaffold protein FimL second domain-containing protein n=1 Tax=Dasania phycosphaerae TaxID=2950436 RepID=A0A9J6RIY9_9GAMM|nr:MULTISPECIES: hypothetical protein [Dasania]MCR8921788.1 hypothetical protein [Dasania sp. GY-MA-18]MCZ0864216.1 hypothetical protein [Dasania phycosphaerae]MCZ0867944.1 hypothetical protein [Dasania phycosphaerae]
MSLDVAINLNSLKLVKEELGNTLAHASTEFEAFLANDDEPAHAEQALTAIQQVAGTFRLLEFPGAALLADEMATTLSALIDGKIKSNEAVLGAITHNLFVLPRYIEYIGIRKAALPSLLIPYINELRMVRKDALLPEYHFVGFEVSASPDLGEGDPQLSLLFNSIARLRHMYQVGFLGLISEKRPSPYFAQLILRALSRVDAMLVGHQGRELWYLAKGFASCWAASPLEPTLNRKRILSAIEGQFRQLLAKGEEALSQDNAQLKKDLLFIIANTDTDDACVQAIKQAYALPAMTMSNAQLAEQRERMYGPSLDTMESVVKVIKEEIRHTKDILEIASQNHAIQPDDHQSLQELVTRIADTLSMLNLSGPRALLQQELEHIKSWSQQSDGGESAAFHNTADTLLFIEGALSSLERREITVDELNNAGDDTRKKIIAESHLAEAQRVVLEEAEAGIALSKRAISSYVESNFDAGHIANIAVTLNTVRGGLLVLNYSRAAAILKSCGAFIDSHIHNKNASAHRHQLLETLADALISMEYYLGEVASGHKVNDKILSVAEESLAALGFEVEAVS